MGRNKPSITHTAGPQAAEAKINYYLFETQCDSIDSVVKMPHLKKLREYAKLVKHMRAEHQLVKKRWLGAAASSETWTRRESSFFS